MKGIFMKIKDEKGFTGIDITVAVIIIMLFMTLIGTIFYNITASHRQLERKTEATYIAIDVMEKLKAQNYDDLIVGEYNNNTIAKILKDEIIEEGYSLKVTIKNYNTPEENSYDLVKIITVKVEYKVGKNTENVELKTTVTREN
jgi:type II secretory pathway pseudopilin PulG